MRDSTPQPGISATYRTALDDYRERRYKAALERFGDVLSAAPSGNLADNSQYWMGECYYGLDEYRAALAEFTKVFAYSETEKDDDAQVMIARCQICGQGLLPIGIDFSLREPPSRSPRLV